MMVRMFKTCSPVRALSYCCLLFLLSVLCFTVNSFFLYFILCEHLALLTQDVPPYPSAFYADAPTNALVRGVLLAISQTYLGHRTDCQFEPPICLSPRWSR